VLLGTAVGVLPGLGTSMSVALLLPLTYALEPTSAFIMFAGIFYGGAYEGVAGPEAANNASAAGSMTSLLTLGLPTSATTAVMPTAFTTYGIQPGPQLKSNEPELVWALIASLFIGNTLLLVINLPLAPVWAKLLRIPRPYLYGGIIFFAVLGTYSLNAQPVDDPGL
jgi:putative tricarboxylic transport membrane protein